MSRGIAIILLFCVSVKVVYACFCMPKSSEDKVKDNDFVGIVSVEDNGTEIGTGNKQKFAIRVIERWKGSDDFKFIETAKGPASCGVYLKQDEYLIAANIVFNTTDTLHMDQCNSYMQKSSLLSAEERESLHKIAVD